ncbi:S1C family serine protease [Enterocloster sp.]|uniref:S1C family serine protease n=1 Tax=Enterocloster sp. TaxID=2719315 RepID=UPI00399369E3
MYQEDQDHNWDREPGREEEKPRRGGILKKAAWITAGALLFGMIAGGVMVGVQVASSDLFKELYTVVAGDQAAGAVKAPAPGGPMGQGENGPGLATPSYIAAPVTDVSVIVEQAMPSVVSITSTAVYQSRDFGYDWFFGGTPEGQTYEVPSSGSGIIIGENDTELLIVTNNHVVEAATSLKVTFIDQETVDAVIKGTDPETDLAVIAISLDQIKDGTKSQIRPATLGNSDDLKPGQGVIAIGNALGYGQSVTVGYISAVNREVQTEEGNTRLLLQTDAAINPGNSGGALLNMKGELVGINAAKYASTEVEGIGYAIPISKSEDIINQLMTRKSRTSVPEEERGYLGIQGTNVDENAARTFGMPKGAYIYRILENGAAAASELREKDIITKVDGQTVRSMEGLQEILAGYRSGEQAELTVQRQVDGSYQELTVTVTLAGMPQEDQGR